MSYFIFRNVNSKDIGIIVNKVPTRVIPERRKEFIEIQGRNGYLTIDDETYAPIEIQLECTIRNDADIDSIASLLTGKGNLIISNNLNRYYEAEVINSITLENILNNYKRVLISFYCQPFSKSIIETVRSLVVGNNSFNIDGTAGAIPIIKLQGTGSYRLTFDTVKVMDIEDVLTDIKIDNELMNATSIDGTLNLNNKISGEFLKLNNGINVIDVQVISGTNPIITLKYKEAWL